MGTVLPGGGRVVDLADAFWGGAVAPGWGGPKGSPDQRTVPGHTGSGAPSTGGTVAPPPQSGTVVITGVLPPEASVTLLTASDGVSFQGGVGGWEDVERRGMAPGKRWRGGEATSCTIQGFLHLRRRGFDRGDVGDRITRLVSLGRRRGSDPHPSPVVLAGDVRHPDADGGGQWVIQDVSLGMPLRRDGVIILQPVTVELASYAAFRDLAPAAVAATRRGSASASRQVTTRQGDTMRSLATRELGTPTRWTDIRTWNKSLAGKNPVGPDTPLRPGMRIVIK